MVPISAIERIELQSSVFVLEPKHDTIKRIYAQAQEAVIKRTTTSALALALSPWIKCVPQEPWRLECAWAHSRWSGSAEP